MKNLFTFFLSLFLMGQIATAQFHNTTIDYTLDTDCSTDISEAGGSYAYKINIDHSTGGWQGGEGPAWLSHVGITYKLEFTNTATGNVDYTHTTSHTLPNGGTTLSISHNMLYQNLEDGEYTVRLFVKAVRNGNSPTPVNFSIDDLTSGQSSQNILQANNSFVELNTGIIFCFEYQKCDDIEVSIFEGGNTYFGFANSNTAVDISFTWVITYGPFNEEFIFGVTQIPVPLECVSVEFIVTDNTTGCRYSATRACVTALCPLPTPAPLPYISQSLSNGSFVISWGAVTGADSYKLVLIYNDPNCCGFENPLQDPEIIETTDNFITVSSFKKYNCFSLQIAAVCATGGFGQPSPPICFDLPSPFRSSGETSEISPSATKESIALYPNPASDQVQIELTGAEGTTSNITIFDAKGALIMNRNLTIESGKNEITWNLTNVPTGVYFVRSTNGAEVMTEKLIVTK